MKKFFLMTFVLVFSLSAIIAQDTLFVKTDINAWQGESAYTDLQTAIDAAVSGDQIWVAEGTYRPTSGINNGTGQLRSFLMKSGVSIFGGFAGTETTLEEREKGENSWDFIHPTVLSGDINQTPFTLTDDVYHVLWFGNNPYATDVTINGFTIEYGYATGPEDIHQKAGVANMQDNCIISNCIMQKNCAATGGGALYMNSGSRVIDSYFFNNRALYASGKGGAVYAAGNNFMEEKVTGCLFENNTISTTNSEGGAIYAGTNNQFSNSTFRRNSCAKNGGTFCANAAGNQLNNCIFEQNNSTNGGAVYSTNTNLVMSNCLYTNNYATAKGGAVYATGSGSKIINSTLVNNNASEAGAVFGNSNLILFNTIAWNNNAGTDAQVTASITCYYTAVQDVLLSGTGNLNLPADNAAGVHFVNPSTVIGLPADAQDSLSVATADYNLTAESVCKDTGNTSNIYLSGYIFPETDLKGDPRIDGANIDLGAFEKQCLIEMPIFEYLVTDTLNDSTVNVQFTIFNYDESLGYLFTINGETQTLSAYICEIPVRVPATLECQLLAQNNTTGCVMSMTETIDIDSIANVGIIENSISSFQIYPNPTTDFIYINAKEWQSEAYQIIICNWEGKQVYRSQFAEETTIDLSDLCPGIYLMEIRNNYSKQYYKVIKQ